MNIPQKWSIPHPVHATCILSMELNACYEERESVRSRGTDCARCLTVSAQGDTVSASNVSRSTFRPGGHLRVERVIY